MAQADFCPIEDFQSACQETYPGLPIVDGLKVAKWIRQEPALRNPVLVALTGYGQPFDRQRTSEAGFDHHLVKPVDFGKVKNILSTTARHRGLYVW